MTKRSRTTHLLFHTAAWPGDPSAAEIDRAHRQRGFSSIGYHLVIRKDGTVETGRPIDAVGAHCRDGGMNPVSIGVCFSGHHGDDYHNVRGEEWTEAQRRSWLAVASDLCRRYRIPVRNVIGHKEAGAKKACPGDRIDCEAVRRELAAHLGAHAARAPLPVIGKGDTGPAVEALQRALRDAREYRGNIDGDFGPLTDRALRAFQARHRLRTDGIAGPNVWRTLQRMGLAQEIG